MSRSAFSLCWMLVGLVLCPAAGAQASPKLIMPDSSNVLLLDHDFTGPNEFVRVFLQDGQVYRAELSTPDVTLQILGLVRNQELPRVYSFLPSRTPSGSSVVEIYPQVDAVYEVRALTTSGTAVSTRMRLYRDIAASSRRQQVRNSPGWEIGIEMAGAWHSGFRQCSAEPLTGSDPAAGTDIDACFSARNAPGLDRLGMCVLGVSYQSQHEARSIVWFYTEPRVRLLGRSRSRPSPWELGVLFRLGIGMISESSNTPTVFGPGVYLARHLSGPRRGGWTLQAAYARQFYRGFATPSGSGAPATPRSHRLSLGLGWYR
jgi:hypothetical protein